METLARRLSPTHHRRAWFHFLALLVALLAALPLLQDGALLNTRGGGDSPFLLQRVQQLVSALADGHFPVRWMPDAAYGYGYPFFNYYAPLSIYVAAFFRLLGAPFTAAIQLAQLSAFLLAAWAAFELARRWLGDDWAALLASAAYTLAPFHLLNVYVRGDSLAEFWAMALYPLVLLAADRLLLPGAHGEHTTVLARGIPTRIAHLALAYAALILSHNISALIFSPFLLLYVLLVTPPALRQALLHPALALLGGLLLSAWFWLPALGETSLVQTAPVTAGYFHYANHFRGVDLVQPSFFFDWQVAGQTAFRMGLLQALLSVAGLLVVLWLVARWRQGRPNNTRLRSLLFATGAFFVATYMITPLSRWLWGTLPLLPFAQFPWRFLSVQALTGALLAGALALLPGRRLWSIAGIILLLAAMLPTLKVDHIALGDADVTPLRLAQYEWFTGNIGTTVSAEYLPKTVQPRPFTSAWVNSGDRDAVQILSGEATVRLLARQATRQTWQVQVGGDGAVLEMPTLYWPGWRARLAGQQSQTQAVSAAPGSGLIMVELPPGTHTLELWLARTPLRLAAELVSMVAVLALLAFLVRLALAARRRILPTWKRRRGALLLLGAALLVLILFWRLRPDPRFEAQTLSWDFAQLGYLHHAPSGIGFEDGARLARYDYSAPAVMAGQTLRVDLEWATAGAEGDDATVALVTPAAHRFDAAPPLVSARHSVRPGRVRYELAIPANAPPGLYTVRLSREVAPSLTPSGEPRGALFLRPLHIVHDGEPAPAGRALDARLDDILLPATLPLLDRNASGLFDCAAGENSPGALLVQLAWSAEQPLAPNLTASLRLNDAAGRRIAQCDMQPGYGYLPSGIWPPATWIPDRLALPLPPSLPADGPYALLITLYDESGATVLVRRLGQLRWQDDDLRFEAHKPQFVLPDDITPLEARFGEAIALRGYDLRQTNDQLQLVLYWEALQPVPQDYTRFVHLLPGEGDAPLVQQDGAPQNGSYPTSQWTAGEIVADPVTLDIATLPGDEPLPAALRLAVGFYPPQDPTARLPVTDEQDQTLPDGRLLLQP